MMGWPSPCFVSLVGRGLRCRLLRVHRQRQNALSLRGRDAILARQAQSRLLRWFRQSQRSDRGWGGADDSSQRGQGQKLAAIQVHMLAVDYVAAQKAKIGEFVPLYSSC